VFLSSISAFVGEKIFVGPMHLKLITFRVYSMRLKVECTYVVSMSDSMPGLMSILKQQANYSIRIFHNTPLLGVRLQVVSIEQVIELCSEKMRTQLHTLAEASSCRLTFFFRSPLHSAVAYSAFCIKKTTCAAASLQARREALTCPSICVERSAASSPL
jgi:hypothetical protein